MKYDEICDCVIITLAPHEDYRLRRIRVKGDEKQEHEYKSQLFTDGRTLIPNADCKKCHGTGFNR